MLQDAAIRLNFVNAIVDGMDANVNHAWELTCIKTLADTDSGGIIHAKDVFRYRNEFLPASAAKKYKKIYLRQHALPLPDGMEDDFTPLYNLFVTEYAIIRGKFKAMLSDLCRNAVSIDCFAQVLPEVLLRNTHDLSYVPMRTAEGVEQNLAHFDKYKEVIDRATYYTSIRQLI